VALVNIINSRYYQTLLRTRIELLTNLLSPSLKHLTIRDVFLTQSASPYRFPLPKRNILLREGTMAQVGGVYSSLLYQLSNSPLLLDAPDSQTSLKPLFLKSSDLSNRIPAYALEYWVIQHLFCLSISHPMELQVH
jgi:hypothetical protein